MKKIVILSLALVMIFALSACSSDTSAGNDTANVNAEFASETSDEPDAAGEVGPSTVFVITLNAKKEAVEIEVPYDPDRVAILDYAALDMMDSWGIGHKVVGMAKGSAPDYLGSYQEDDSIMNLGSIKDADLEALLSCEPDIIFIGGRLSSLYDTFSDIAPVVYIATDTEKGLLNSVSENANNIAKIFGMEDMVVTQLAGFDERIAVLASAAEGQTALIGMVTSANFNTIANGGRCSIIGDEVGFQNLAGDVESTHGNESSFELIYDVNPDWIFVLDRDAAIQTDGAQLAQEVLDNELIYKTDAYQNDRIVYLNPSVWYVAEGGITATDVMISDLEQGVLGK